MDASKSWLRILPLVTTILTGCPSDDGEAGHDSLGTGSDGPQIPSDPLDDDGAEPPGEPSEEEKYPSPATLGNGLVHDTRYLLGTNVDTVAILNADLDDWRPLGSRGSPDHARGRVSAGAAPRRDQHLRFDDDELDGCHH